MAQQGYFVAHTFDPSAQGLWTDYNLPQDFYTGPGLVQYPSLLGASNSLPLTPSQYAQPTSGPISLDYQVAKKTAGNKQKSARASQACEQCRYRKQKCDEGSPCAFCRENALPCIYRSVTPNRIEKAIESFHASMSSQSRTLSALTKKIENLEGMLREQERKAHGKDSTPFWPLATERMKYWSTASIHDGTGLTAAPDILAWPSIRRLFETAGATLGKDSLWHLEARMAQPSCVKDVAGIADSLSPPELDIYTNSAQSTPASMTSYSSPSFYMLPQSDRPDNVSLTADSGTRLINAYLKHIGSQHPFLDADHARSLMQQFAQANAPRYVNIAPKPLDGHPLKRQRLTPGAKGYGESAIDHSAENALVMLCCALGDAVLHDRLHSSTHSSTHDRNQNPGTQYFDAAAKLIGRFIDGHELVHAQVFLLAGLYKALSLRMREAASWYSMAGQILTYLVYRRGLVEERLPGQMSAPNPEQVQDDLILRAAWTCIQLESEMIPELRLTCSRLSDLAQILRTPSTWITKEDLLHEGWNGQHPAEKTSSLYTAQTTLLKLHLQTLTQLYTPTATTTTPESLNETLTSLATALQHWRSQLPPLLQWSDDAPAPCSTPLAHLRHAYWETKLLLLRPFLDYSLHILPDGADNHRCPTALDTPLLRAVHHKSSTSGSAEVLHLAHLALAAAVQSLGAFDGVPERLLLTNAQSVAHGHFVNAVMLVAARKGGLVAEREVGAVSAKTMGFLGDLAGWSALAGCEREVLGRVVGGWA